MLLLFYYVGIGSITTGVPLYLRPQDSERKRSEAENEKKRVRDERQKALLAAIAVQSTSHAKTLVLSIPICFPLNSSRVQYEYVFVKGARHSSEAAGGAERRGAARADRGLRAAERGGRGHAAWLGRGPGAARRADRGTLLAGAAALPAAPTVGPRADVRRARHVRARLHTTIHCKNYCLHIYRLATIYSTL